MKIKYYGLLRSSILEEYSKQIDEIINQYRSENLEEMYRNIRNDETWKNATLGIMKYADHELKRKIGILDEHSPEEIFSLITKPEWNVPNLGRVGEYFNSNGKLIVALWPMHSYPLQVFTLKDGTDLDKKAELNVIKSGPDYKKIKEFFEDENLSNSENISIQNFYLN